MNTLQGIIKNNNYTPGFVYMRDGGARAMEEFRHLVADGEAHSFSGRLVFGDAAAARYHDLNMALTKSWTWRYDRNDLPINPDDRYSAYEDREVLVIDPLRHLSAEQKARSEQYVGILQSGEGFIKEYKGKPQENARMIAEGRWPDMAADAREYILEHSTIQEKDLGDDEVLLGAVHNYAMDVIGFRAYRYPTEILEEKSSDLSPSLELCATPDADLAEGPTDPGTDTGPVM